MKNLEEVIISVIKGAEEVEAKFKWNGRRYVTSNGMKGKLVRCGECKHNPWNTDADYTCIWDDDFADREQTPDDFCSYGERREP